MNKENHLHTTAYQLSLFEDIQTYTQSSSDYRMGYDYSEKVKSTHKHDEYLKRKEKGVGYNIWSELKFTGSLDIPEIQPYEASIPTQLVPFSKVNWETDASCSVHFYEHDYKFNRFVNNPETYLQILLRMHSVITPDYSQYVEMPAYRRMYNSCLNKEIGAFLQNHGIPIIVNVSWSTPDSYEYAFEGIPLNCVIAVNSNGIKRNNTSRYLWRKGYEYMLERLTPRHIIRYGEKMPYENESISTYFVNEQIKIMRNGR